jgi:Tol biopolymer transport system component
MKLQYCLVLIIIIGLTLFAPYNSRAELNQNYYTYLPLVITAYDTTVSWPIIFSASVNGSYDLFQMNPDGSNVVNLTKTDCNEDEPALSPNGEMIAFTTNCSGNLEINTMNIDGTNRQNITNNQFDDFSPDWSPDGTKIAFTSDRDGYLLDRLYIVDHDGSNLVRLTEVPAYSPDWSPDGNKIAFKGKPGIWYFDLNTSTLSAILTAGGYYSPDWSPDGKKLVVSRISSILTINIDGTDMTDLTPIYPDPWETDTPQWSPDGMRITFMSGEYGSFQIFTMYSDGSHLKAIDTGYGDNWEPVWVQSQIYHIPAETPKEIAIFCSDMTKTQEYLYSLNIDGSQKEILSGPYKFSTYYYDNPGFDWSVDGNTIVFSNKNQLFSVNTLGSGILQISNQQYQVSSDPKNPQISPRGDLVAFFATDIESYTHDIFIMNLYGGNLTHLNLGNLLGDDISSSTFSWSNDGTMIVFAAIYEGSLQIYRINVDGSNLIQLTNNGGREPIWSPVDSTIAYGYAGHIYMMDSDGSNQRQLTSFPGYTPVAGDFAWAPNGEKIAFIGPIGNLYTVNVDGTGQTRLTNDGNPSRRHYHTPSWSSDSEKIIFMRYIIYPNLDTEIYTINPDGTNLNYISTHQSMCLLPQLRP